MPPHATIGLLAGLLLAGCADNSPGGKIAHDRHERFEEIGEAFKTIGDELKGGSPDFAVVRPNAARIAELAPQVKGWFPAGSGPQDGKRTDALEAVWTRPAEFQQAAARFVEQATALKAAADGGDAAALGAAVKDTGAACKACHDKFREE